MQRTGHDERLGSLETRAMRLEEWLEELRAKLLPGSMSGEVQ